MRLLNITLTILLAGILLLAACTPSAPGPSDENQEPNVTETETGTETGTVSDTGDDGATETSTGPVGGPPGAASLADEAAEAAGEGGNGEMSEGFNTENLPEDWPEEIPLRPEFWIRVYEWDGNHMHAEGDTDYDFYGAHNWFVNFTAAGWEHDREDEWVRTGDDRVLWLKREGMVLEVKVDKLDDGMTRLVLDLEKD